MKTYVAMAAVFALLLGSLAAQAQQAGAPAAPPAPAPFNAADLPKAVTDAVKATYPNATIDNGKIYDQNKTCILELTDGTAKIRLAAKLSGQFMYATSTMQAADLPKNISDAVAAAAPGSTVSNVNKSDQFTYTKEGQMQTKTQYMVSLKTAEGGFGVIALDGDGKVIATKGAPVPPKPVAPPAGGNPNGQ